MNLPRIAVVCPRLQLPDAVGYDVIHQVRVLREAGYDARAFAESASAETPAGALREVPAFLTSPRDLLIYHYAVHAPPILELLRNLDCRRILRYHNVTPAHFFEPYDRGYAKALRAGREFLGAHLATGVDLVLSASRENLTDLFQNDCAPEMCVIVPPFHRVPDLLAGEPDPDWVLQLGTESGPRIRNVLAVGRIVPNKGYAVLLRGFAALRNPPARLILVGGQDPRLGTYYSELRTIMKETGIASRVWLPGSVSPAALRAMYRSADVLVSASEHEGFCLPLLEAMAHGLPIVALARTAIPETLGDAGILLESSEPEYLAAAVQKLLSQPELCQKLGAIGRARYAAHFTNENIAAGLLTALNPYATYRTAYSSSPAQ